MIGVGVERMKVRVGVGVCVEESGVLVGETLTVDIPWVDVLINAAGDSWVAAVVGMLSANGIAAGMQAWRKITITLTKMKHLRTLAVYHKIYLTCR
jgi:hypothetical protein